MTHAERIELALIPVAAAAAWAMAARLPTAPGVGTLLLVGAVLLLLQGLLRDLWLLWRRGRQPPAGQPRRMACLCLESTLGSVPALGFAIKDLVIALRPLRLVRDPDHLNIVLGWR